MPDIVALAMKDLEERAVAFITEEVKRLPISEAHKDEYSSAFTVVSDFHTEIVHIAFSTTEWAVFAMESGCPPFSIKDNLLRNAVKVSKKGYRYRTIPMTNRIPSTLTNKQKEDQFWGKNIERDLIKSVIKKLNYKYQLIEEKEQIRPTGEPSFIRREVFTVPAEKPGAKPRKLTERVRVFATKDAFKRKQKPVMTTFTNFKTVSENPESQTDWVHPGFSGYNLIEKISSWCQNQIPSAFGNTIDRLMREV